MFPLAELSGFGLNIEQEMKTMGTANTVIKIILLLIDFLEGSLCVWLKRVSISNYLIQLGLRQYQTVMQ
tara:strand:+ start:236 stop:442 length:207 start_codon:yes stop_codon:yes gene_type:complete